MIYEEVDEIIADSLPGTVLPMEDDENSEAGINGTHRGDYPGEEEVIFEESVSDGDSVDDTVYVQMLESMQLLADSSQQGYLSSNIVNVFDRLVDGGSYRYYVAYRGNGEDSNSGYLYLSNKVNGNQLEECQVIHMYRVNTGNNYEYTYHYDVYYDDAEYFNLGNGSLYYTNISTGYPSLGSPVESKMYHWFPVLAVTVFLAALMIRRKIREC